MIEYGQWVNYLDDDSCVIYHRNYPNDRESIMISKEHDEITFGYDRFVVNDGMWEAQQNEPIEDLKHSAHYGQWHHSSIVIDKETIAFVSDVLEQVKEE